MAPAALTWQDTNACLPAGLQVACFALICRACEVHPGWGFAGWVGAGERSRSLAACSCTRHAAVICARAAGPASASSGTEHTSIQDVRDRPPCLRAVAHTLVLAPAPAAWALARQDSWGKWRRVWLGLYIPYAFRVSAILM